jgi:hypothetical protein
MAFEGKFWLLWEEEPIDVDRGLVVELKDGAIFDGRTDERRGTYSELPEGIELVFDLEHGEQQIARFGRFSKVNQEGAEWTQELLPFDPEGDSFPVTWSTVRYESYVALRPVIENEDIELQAEREHAEGVLFGIVPTHGAALRDGPHIQEMHDENQHQADELPILQ